MAIIINNLLPCLCFNCIANAMIEAINNMLDISVKILVSHFIQKPGFLTFHKYDKYTHANIFISIQIFNTLYLPFIRFSINITIGNINIDIFTIIINISVIFMLDILLLLFRDIWGRFHFCPFVVIFARAKWGRFRFCPRHIFFSSFRLHGMDNWLNMFRILYIFLD